MAQAWISYISTPVEYLRWVAFAALFTVVYLSWLRSGRYTRTCLALALIGAGIFVLALTDSVIRAFA